MVGSETPFNSTIYVDAYAQHVAPHRGETQLVQNLFGRTLGPSLVINAAGRGIADYGDLPVLDEGGCTAIFERALSSANAVLLHNVPVSSPTLTFVETYATERGLHCSATQGGVSPYLDLDLEWEDLLRRKRSKKSRHNLRWAEKKLFASSHFSYEIGDGSKSVDRILDLAFTLVEKRPNTPRRAWTLLDPRIQEMVRSFASGYAAAGRLDLRAMCIGSRPLAFSMSVREGPTWFYLYARSDVTAPEARLSPGMVMLADVIRTACEAGSARFDFLLGDEPYKARWCDGITSTQNIIVSGSSFRSAAARTVLVGGIRTQSLLRSSKLARGAAEWLGGRAERSNR